MNIFKMADWLEDEKEINSAYFDPERNIFIEGPVDPLWPPPIEKSIKHLDIRNVLFGRNTLKFASGHFSPNVIIGRYCSIAQLVSIGATAHDMNYLSTGFINSTYYSKEEKEEERDLPFTIIGCDVWVGLQALILGGAKIGHGACIGAGAIVKKEIPPYAIAVGSPARVVKTRFSDEIISDLMDLKWWTLSPEVVNALPYKNIKECIEKLKEIRRSM